MKVYEKIMKLTNSNKSLDVLANTAYTNGACPICIEDILQIDNYPDELVELGLRHCECNCGFDCLYEFLKKEVDEIESEIAKT